MIFVVQRYSVLSGHLGLELVHGEAHVDEVLLGRGVALLLSSNLKALLTESCILNILKLILDLNCIQLNVGN